MMEDSQMILPLNSHGNLYLKNVMIAAKIPPEQQTVIMQEYQDFKKRFIEVAEGRCNNILITQNEGCLFELHVCSLDCGVTSRQHTQCKDSMMVVSQRKVITSKQGRIQRKF